LAGLRDLIAAVRTKCIGTTNPTAGLRTSWHSRPSFLLAWADVPRPVQGQASLATQAR
jgi:hypothetical protein